jgi:hypothetical protein
VHLPSSNGLLNKATRGFLIAVLFLSACGTQRDLSHQTRSVVGILYVTGNEPFTDLALQTNDGGVLKIRKDTTAVYRELRGLQGQKLRVHFKSFDSKPDTSSISVVRYDLVETH